LWPSADTILAGFQALSICEFSQIEQAQAEGHKKFFLCPARRCVVWFRIMFVAASRELIATGRTKYRWGWVETNGESYWGLVATTVEIDGDEMGMNGEEGHLG
jgi:hypothetical protein